MPHGLVFVFNNNILSLKKNANFLLQFSILSFSNFVSVKTCSKVSDALNLLMEKRDGFDMVLIEAKMPDMDSYDFLQYVTQQINIPVISKYIFYN
jgi:response regulator RpfG family c-di-GMP phosphodiesterase